MTSLSVSKIFAMGVGKSLYFKILQPLRFLITAIAIIAVMLFANTENAYSQCPPGFNGPYQISIHKCPGCRVEVDYCLSNPSPGSGLCNIHIMNIRYIGSSCSGCLPVDQNGNYVIGWADIVTAIARKPEHYSCFQMITLLPCDEQVSRPTILVSNGGCYNVNEGLNQDGEYVKEYIPCDMMGISYCYQNFSFCLERVREEWKITAVAGPVTPQFQCLEEGCYSLCND